MSFRYPLFLLLIPPVLWLLYSALRSNRATKVLYFPLANRQFSFRTARMLLPVWLPFGLRALAFALSIAALARPQTSTSMARRLSEGIDIMISFDVSQSMLIEDMGKKNRIDAAKETVHSFIEGRKDDRIGFSVFSGEAITLCPPTLDYEFLHSAVNMADVNQLRDGTAIGEGLAIAVNRLKESRAKSRVVILITDGDNNMGSIAPLTAGDIAAGYGIKVYTIALGSEGLVNIPGYVNVFGSKQKVMTQLVSSINPTLLMKIADVTNGKFYRASDQGSLHRIFNDIDKLERSKIERKDRVLWTEHFQLLLALAFLFLTVDLILRSTVFRVLPE
ncbi:MAG TPA: VWA domain-containing protein [Bdellovibrionota bacterium]|jgi:Ca-activated chloride channel family protein